MLLRYSPCSAAVVPGHMALVSHQTQVLKRKRTWRSKVAKYSTYFARHFSPSKGFCKHCSNWQIREIVKRSFTIIGLKPLTSEAQESNLKCTGITVL